MQPSADRLFEVVEYAAEAHGAFVRSTWAHGALRDGSRAARRLLDELVAKPDARCVVATSRGEDPRLAGWGVRKGRLLVFAYVKPAVRGRGLGSLIVSALGLDNAQPIPLMVWTPSSQAIAAAGRRRVYHAQFPLEE